LLRLGPCPAQKSLAFQDALTLCGITLEIVRIPASYGIIQWNDTFCAAMKLARPSQSKLMMIH
jgi:hypothetical protein